MKSVATSAVTEFKIAEKCDPSDPLPHAYIGFCLLFEGKFPEAKAKLEHALKLDPKCYEALTFFATYYDFQGDDQQCER